MKEWFIHLYDNTIYLYSFIKNWFRYRFFGFKNTINRKAIKSIKNNKDVSNDISVVKVKLKKVTVKKKDKNEN